MQKFPKKNPEPDFYELKKVLSGEKLPKKVHPVDLFIDEEIKKYILENYFNEKNIAEPFMSSFFIKDKVDIEKLYKEYYKQLINFWYRMGYSFLVITEFSIKFVSLFMAKNVARVAKDTAIYTRGDRFWVKEGTEGGVIKSQEDFEKFPWDMTKTFLSELESHLDFISKNLPAGMKVCVSGSLFEHVMEFILGYENFFYFLYDQPELVKNVIDKVGQIEYDLFSSVASMDCVGILILTDDLGFKTSSIISVEHLRKLFFPWYKKYASIAHKNNKQIWHHCCGNKNGIMEDLISNIKIDALHSFEDSCAPIIEIKKKYGDRIGLIGGVDMDKLIRLEEKELRKYIRSILDACMIRGRFALGSGNSICNFMPVKNYFIMLEEGLNWVG
jgi:uroporphyrinogen decarboxylase